MFAAYRCALGDAAAITLPAAAVVDINVPDPPRNPDGTQDRGPTDSNKIIITGTGTINSFGAGTQRVTKDVTFQPVGGAITLTNSATLALLGNSNRVITGQAFGRYACDGLGNWQEIGWAATAATPGSGGFSSFNLYTASQTITIPNVTRALVKLQGNGGEAQRPSSTTINGGNGGYLEKWLSGLLVGKTLILTIGGSGAACTLASGTQTIGTLSCAQGQNGSQNSGVATGGDINIGGTISSNPYAADYVSQLNAMGYGGGSVTVGSNNPGACAIEWWS